MLKQIRIQNFKSLKDVTLDLDQVNLFIGPNNSGKSNVLNALKYFAKIYLARKSPEFNNDNTFMRGVLSHENVYSISFKLELNKCFYLYKFELFGTPNSHQPNFTEFFGVSINPDFPLQNLLLKDFFSYYDGFSAYAINSCSPVLEKLVIDKIGGFGDNVSYGRLDGFILEKKENKAEKLSKEIYAPGAIVRSIAYQFGIYLDDFLSSIAIYKPDIGMIQSPNLVDKEELPLDFLEENCYNLAEFLFNFSQNHKKKFNSFLEDFKTCVPEFIDISTPYNPEDKSKSSLKLKFFDDYENGYWIDEVSDGVIYFLALLAIIHQPNPPEILLLEEPETGIHPRRIKEITDYIFKLAEEKNIQVILTSHSPLLLEKFNTIPQAVFVFDKENGETKIKNLFHDIIEVNNKKLSDKGLPEINYTSSLGEHWLDGFIGGVPDEAN